MIERKIIAEKMKEFEIQEYISKNFTNVGHSHTKLQRTPLGEKIIIFSSRPGLVVGKSGENIKKITRNLKKNFNLENPQIEISEVENPMLNASIVTEQIVSALERFGSQRFKGVGHKMMSEVMNAGARGVEIVMSGKIPGARAKSWRFYAGYLKKCGDLAITGVDAACGAAKLKAGVIGVRVKIMSPDVLLPDKLELLPRAAVEQKEAEVKEEKEEKKEEKKPKKARKPRAKKPRKTAEKKIAAGDEEAKK